MRKARPALSFVRAKLRSRESRGPRFSKSAAGTATHRRHIM